MATKHHEGYTKTDIMGACGTEIICKSCGYAGQAEVIRSTIFGAGKLERCPGCKGKNYSEVIVMNWTIDEWKGCYPSSWKGVIVPDAMKHPAKFSSKLIRKIYDHMKTEGWLKKGDVVVDPFGGVALGAFEAMRNGLRWRGNELEARFADMGAHNISNWNVKYSRMEDWCSDALLYCGDSRNLLQILRGENGNGPVSFSLLEGNTPKLETKEQYQLPGMDGLGDVKHESTPGHSQAIKAENVNAAISSPPYADISQTGGTEGLKKHGTGLTQGDACFSEYGAEDGQLGAMKSTEETFAAAISSPPFRHSEGGTPEPKPGGSIDKALYARHAAGNSAAEGYGGTDGQLANMAEGDFGAAVSSPPYNLPMSQEHNGKRGGKRGTTPPGDDPNAFVKYGNTPGQLEGMKDDGFDAAVSSPPFENSVDRAFMDAGDRREHARKNGISNAEHVSPIDLNRLQASNELYGTTKGQLGADSGDDFWMAARTIVEQVYQALAPGAHAAWVVKGFVKNKEYVDFPDQWRRLCEAVGFVTVHEHRAMLVHSKGKSINFEGETIEHRTESKSFFRRLAEKKGSPRVDWETVLCMVKPEEVAR